MNIRRIKFWFLFVIASACSPSRVDDPVPFIPFDDIVINLNLPEYNNLRTDGGYVQINGGVRGIIVYRVNSSSYVAYDRNCSYRPNEACATVNVHNSGLYMEDPCCGSSFNFSDGNPSGGPAWRPLVSYRTQYSGLTVTISSEVIN
jgi:nitrite reductase/ring-hydroxylating ferredoxin subunit